MPATSRADITRIAIMMGMRRRRSAGVKSFRSLRIVCIGNLWGLVLRSDSHYQYGAVPASFVSAFLMRFSRSWKRRRRNGPDCNDSRCALTSAMIVRNGSNSCFKCFAGNALSARIFDWMNLSKRLIPAGGSCRNRCSFPLRTIAWNKCRLLISPRTEPNRLSPALTDFLAGSLFTNQKLYPRDISEPYIHALSGDRIPLGKVFFYSTCIGKEKVLVGGIGIKGEPAYVTAINTPVVEKNDCPVLILGPIDCRPYGLRVRLDALQPLYSLREPEPGFPQPSSKQPDTNSSPDKYEKKSDWGYSGITCTLGRKLITGPMKYEGGQCNTVYQRPRYPDEVRTTSCRIYSTIHLNREKPRQDKIDEL
jgi:hypothetical protein